MAIIKFIGYFFLIAILLFIFVANFSSVESNFECSGEMTSNGSSKPSTIYIKFEKYRWWIGGDSDGNLYLEIPNETVQYFSNVVDVGPQVQILSSQNEIKGNFSTLSKTLAFSTPVGFFDGTCKNTR